MLIIAIAIALLALLYLTPHVRADEPGVGSVVCAQLDLGVPPEVIAEQLHEGDRRWSYAQTIATVLDDMARCD